jgi:Holliday junction resolvasome RuvABC ATP-dependent DNA helicase subunit
MSTDTMQHSQQQLKQSVRQVLFGFKDNLVIQGPPGVGKLSMALEEISLHGTPYIHVLCSQYTADDFWDFKRMLMDEADETVILLDEANSLPPSLAELIYMYIEVYERKGIIALVQGPRKGDNTHLCFNEIIPNRVTIQ